MDGIEKNIKNTEVVRYTKKIDLRELMERLQVKVYGTGTWMGAKLNKSQFITMDYDVNKPVLLYLTYNGKNLVDGYLYFKSEDFIRGQLKLNKKSFLSDFIIRLNKESNRTLSLRQVGTRLNKSLLTTKEIFSVTQRPALQLFSSPIDRKKHAIEMVLPGISEIFTKNMNNLGFDIDMNTFSTTGPLTSLFFKLSVPGGDVIKYKNNKTGNVDTTTIIKPKRIATLAKSPTSYVEMTSKDLEIGQVKFNYVDYFKELNQDYNDHYLSSSEVFIVKNTENYKLNIGNFISDSTKELPYNVSRRLVGNDITASSPFFDRGLTKYPLSWASELRNNKFFTKLNRCMEFSFYSNEHLNSFQEILRENQIANLEEYTYYDEDNILQTQPRTYTNISDWVSRTDIDYFNDLNITYKNDGRLNSLTICPSKQSKVNGYEKNVIWENNKCSCKYSDDVSQKLKTVIVPSTTKECSEVCKEYQMTENLSKCWTCEKEYMSPIYDLRNDFFGTTYSTFRESFTGGTKYTGYTSGAITGDNSYDIYFSGNSYTATTFPDTGIAIPIDNINRIEHRPFVGVSSPYWVPFYSWQSLSGQTGTSSGSGAVIIQTGDPKNYLIYKSLSGGTYKFQYNAYLDVKYTDTKWCEYVATNYISGATTSISYPSSEYHIKRLINSSIIEKGLTEGNTVKEDTNGIYFPGKHGINPNTGVNNFQFDVFLEKENITGTTSNIVSTSIGASPLTNPTSNLYLISPTNIVQNTMSGFSNCYMSAATANTVFHARIPISLNTGLISLSSGESVTLKYDTEFSATSKVTGGNAYIELNLGHQLDLSGNVVSSPFYRVTKYSPTTGTTSTLQKKLFLNAQKLSTPHKYFNRDNKKVEGSSVGSLYVIDKGYSPISHPKVTSQTFRTLNFIDNIKGSTTFNLDTNSKSPTNNWASQLENSDLTDYYLPNNVDLIDIQSGILIFNLPRYDQKDSVNCNYKFPQISHSYVIKNTISNVKGVEIEHFIVVTPKETIYVPCFGATKDDKVDLIESEIKIREEIDNVDSEIIIDDQPIILKSARSLPITELKSLDGFRCKFYCVCNDKRSNLLIDPFYGTTEIFTDTAIKNCNDCESKANIYCTSVNKTCVAKVFTQTCIGDKNNLYTNGDDYLLPSGNIYVGFYHTHNGETMVGASHNINDTDEVLTPINGINTNTTQTQNTSNSSTNSSSGGY
tara:strand:- start:1221 stop:4826 length:3606 start_codon:yes stop_codon:yes gene_type:complete